VSRPRSCHTTTPRIAASTPAIAQGSDARFDERVVTAAES
jgi:hypothetical protein